MANVTYYIGAGASAGKRILKVLAQHKVLLLGLCVLFVLRPTFVEWIKEYLCPLTPIEIDNNGWVLSVIIVAIILCYVVNLNRLLKERELIISRYVTLVLLFGGWCIFRYTNAFDFYSIEGWKLNYFECAWVIIGAIEVGWLIYRIYEKVRRKSDVKGYPFMTDAPALKDEMGRDKYAEQLVEKIYATHKSEDASCGAFAILLNEHYGAGKTTFMIQLQELAGKKKIDVCWFKPWLYDDNKTLIVNFIKVIQEMIGDGDKPLQKMLSRYAQALSSIEKFEWLSILQTNESSIETQFEDIKAKLQKLKQPIVVLIDDVDRLQNEELLQLLQMVRNMGDFPSLYYIIAADKEALQNRLREAGVTEPDEYLKKFFNLEITFPADEMNLMLILLEGLQDISRRYTLFMPDELWDFIKHVRYRYEIFATIRDVKRFLNELDYTLANLHANNLTSDIYLPDVVGVCMIQCVDSEFYRILRDHHEYVLTPKNQTYQVREDLMRLFVDRDTKLSTIRFLASKEKTHSQAEEDMLKEMENQTKTLFDFEKWVKPTKIEIIGELLTLLFPHTHLPKSIKSVCYRTEYFKYFASSYKSTELSNVDISDLMVEDMETFKRDVLKIIDAGKVEAMRHKISWYLPMYMNDRIDALTRVMTAFDMEMYRANDKSDNFKYIYFEQNYVGLVASIFEKRSLMLESEAKAEWDKISEWLKHDCKLDIQLWVLMALAKDMSIYSSYIFKSHDEVMNLVEECERIFVQEVWSKNMYDMAICGYIKSYREIDPKINEFIIQHLSRKPRNRVFLYHLMIYKDGKLDWNDGLIDNVIGSPTAFRYANSPWMTIVPVDWIKEFENIEMQDSISEEDLQHWDYFKKTLQYWKRKKAVKRV